MTSMMTERRIRLAAFDFDGTLVQTEALGMRYTISQLKAHHIVFTHDDIAALSGANGDTRPIVMDARFVDQQGWQKCRDEVVSMRGFGPVNLNTIVSPNASVLLSWLVHHGTVCAVCTNSSEERVRKGLQEIGLDWYIQRIYSPRNGGLPKPDPWVYQQAMKDAHASGAQTIVLEDSKAGIEAGKRAGAFVISLKDHDGYCDQSQADRRVDSLAEVIGIVRALERQEM